MATSQNSAPVADIYTDMCATYRRKRKALPISFRELVPWIPYNTDRYTHLLHPYPAKLIPQIPHFVLSVPQVAPPGAVVYDPFCGSGTVLLESIILGHDCIGSDSNPFARLLSRTKTTIVSPERLAQIIQHATRWIPRTKRRTTPQVVNLRYWYTEKAIDGLAQIAAYVETITNPQVKDILQVALSLAARKLSLADPRIAVPVRLNPQKYPVAHPLRSRAESHLLAARTADPVAIFLQQLSSVVDRIATLHDIRKAAGSTLDLTDNCLPHGPETRQTIPHNTFDLIITSPPYLGAQKYVRSTSLSLGWLALASPEQLRALEDCCIGREHFPKSAVEAVKATPPRKLDPRLRSVVPVNPTRATIANAYLKEMDAALAQCAKLLRPTGTLVLVIGANTLCGRPFDTPAILLEFALKHGLKPQLLLTDEIKSRGLMTRRNWTAGLIPNETVAFLRPE